MDGGPCSMDGDPIHGSLHILVDLDIRGCRKIFIRFRRYNSYIGAGQAGPLRNFLFDKQHTQLPGQELNLRCHPSLSSVYSMLLLGPAAWYSHICSYENIPSFPVHAPAFFINCGQKRKKRNPPKKTMQIGGEEWKISLFSHFIEVCIC